MIRPESAIPTTRGVLLDVLPLYTVETPYHVIQPRGKGPEAVANWLGLLCTVEVVGW